MDKYIPTSEDLSLESYCDREIEKHRKTVGSIRLVDKDKCPLVKRDIHIRLKRHAFHFGGWAWTPRTSLNPRIDNAAAREHYIDRYCKLFNYATAMMYWDELAGFPTWEKQQGRTRPDFVDELLSWTESHRIGIKGHTLVWTKPNALPLWYRNASKQARAVYQENRVRSLVAGWRGKIDSWDVANECLWEVIPDNLGIKHWADREELKDIADYVSPAFRWAREENPSAELLINEYGLEYDLNPEDTRILPAKTQLERYRTLIEMLGDRGTAPDGIGLQTHHSPVWFDPEVLRKTWDYLAETGIPLHITEVVAGYLSGPITGGWKTGEWTPASRAYAFRQLYKLAFAYPQIESIITYSTMHYGYNWDCKPDPLYDALYELIVGEWSYDETLSTDENGEIHFRGFYGDYELTVADGLREYRFDLTLSKTMRYKNDVCIQI